MKKATVGKILFIGFISTVIRILFQLMIPSYKQEVLAPSIFVQKGIMPFAFSVYTFLSYSIITAMYLLVENKIPGKKILKGLKYGCVYCLIWVVYLFEPLPHSEGAGFINIIAYPLADGIALIALGLLIGILLAKDSDKPEVKQNVYMNKAGFSFMCIFACFVTGRVFLYTFMDIYSSINTHFFGTILWVIITGVTVSAALIWLGQFIVDRSKVIRAVLVGCVLFGVNLILFNFFIPLVFMSNISDLLIRTFVEILFVAVGMFFLPDRMTLIISDKNSI
ncbi:MAG: hypothetical protein VB111_05745 [Clostridiaceae bacterium]|nr:hypothetical protein [Clostridiaceae bacterium]